MKTILTPLFIGKHCVASVYGEIDAEQLSLAETMEVIKTYDIAIVEIRDSLSLELYLILTPDDADQYDFIQDCAQCESWFY